MQATKRQLPQEAVFGPITRTDIVRYAGAGGDFNPMHHDDEYARAHGHPSVFAMGLLTAGMLGSYVEGLYGLQEVVQLQVRFVAPVWPGESLTCAVTSRERADDGRLAVTLEVLNESGQVKIRGLAVMRGDG